MASLRQMKQVIDALDDEDVMRAEELAHELAAMIAAFGEYAKKPKIKKRAPEIAQRLAALGLETAGDALKTTLP